MNFKGFAPAEFHEKESMHLSLWSCFPFRIEPDKKAAGMQLDPFRLW